ncbi:MAG: DUF4274 domain-containing protein [Bacteroidota bacterium]
MTIIIPQHRIALLQDAFFEYSGEEAEDETDVPDRNLFESITDPAELHFIADIYNWDDGTTVLEWIVDSPLCEPATAKMIFWRSQPDYYTTIEKEEEAGWALDVYQLLKKILKHFQEDRYQAGNIGYDPKQDTCAPEDLDYRDPAETWTIPDWMKTPIPGAQVRYEGW